MIKELKQPKIPQLNEQYLTESQARSVINESFSKFSGTQRVLSGNIQSGNFVTGSAGWALNSSGDIEVNSGTFRGDISIGSGDSIFKADSNGIYLGDAVFADAPFKVTPAGALTATGSTISGAITATGGSITGNLTVSGALISGDVEATNVYLGTISGNTGLVVRSATTYKGGLTYSGTEVLLDSVANLKLTADETMSFYMESAKIAEINTDGRFIVQGGYSVKDWTVPGEYNNGISELIELGTGAGYDYIVVQGGIITEAGNYD